MSSHAKEEVGADLNNIATEIMATRILTKRNDARGSYRSRAARRWPFELLQNAHDPGPRPGKSKVDFSLELSSDKLEVSHNGRPFDSREIAALISGGTSKEYDGSETTGRFGTGFLVTHVLSTKVRVGGILCMEGRRHERFSIPLDRSGDKGAIITDVRRSSDAFGEAQMLENISGVSTAEFRYSLNGDKAIEAAERGVRRLIKVLPYLYATCPKLGQVSITRYGEWHTWKPGRREEQVLQKGLMIDRVVEHTSKDGVHQLRALRVAPSESAKGALLLILEQEGEGWGVDIAPEQFPRVFVKFPIANSKFLPFNVVLDGAFTPSQERDSIQMGEEDRALIEETVAVLPEIAVHARNQGWFRGHQIARLSPPSRTFSEDERDDELEWWKGLFAETAERLARLPLIDTCEGAFPAVADSTEGQAQFVYPRFSLDSDNELDAAAFYALVNKVDGINPVRESLVGEWARLADGWSRLGVQVSRISLKELSGYVSERASRIEELPVEGEAVYWLGDFMQVLGSVSEDRNAISLLEDLLPNQNGYFQSVDNLRIDAGISEELKDIAQLSGQRVRSRLLHSQLLRYIEETELESAAGLIHRLNLTEVGEEEVVDRCVDRFQKRIPSEGRVETEKYKELLQASAKLCVYLANSSVANKEEKARACPLLTLSGSAEQLGVNKSIMAPVPYWPEKARPFADVYSPKRVLSSYYCNKDEIPEAFVPALESLGVVYGEPLVFASRSEVKGKLLSELAAEDEETDGVVLRKKRFSQIALLEEVLPRCQQDKEVAEALLGLVLIYCASRDSKWKSFRSEEGTRNRNRVSVRVRQAIWPADLTSKAWIPVEVEDGESSVTPASPGVVKELLKPGWLHANQPAIELLHQCFGLSRIDLQLSAISEDSERERVEESLSDLVRAGLSDMDADDVQALTDEITRKRKVNRLRERNRRFGLAVQDAVEDYLKRRGFNVEVVDCGYDFDVSVTDEIPSIEDGTHRLKVGESFLLEVKATTTGEVRLTPTQAETATTQTERFVLCVVDLRNLPSGEPLDREWTPEDIEPHAKIVSMIGKEVGKTWEFIELLAEGEDISIRRQNELRYAVAPQLWEEGNDIEGWVEEIVAEIEE